MKTEQLNNVLSFIITHEIDYSVSWNRRKQNFLLRKFQWPKRLKIRFKPTLFKKERHRLKQRDLGRRIGRIFYSGQVFEGIELDTLWIL